MPYLPSGPSPGAIASTAPDRSPAVLVTGDDALAQECRLVANSVGVPILVLPSQPAPASIGRATLVLAEPDAVQWLAREHPDVAVVTIGSDSCEAGSVEVIRLPAGRARLAALLADAAAPADGIELAVVGCAGGVGTTTVACAVARAARARACLLIETDAHGPGMDAVLGTEDERGLRWDDLAEVRGALVAGALTAELPHWHGVSLLGHRFPPLDGPPVTLQPPAVHAVLRAARREFRLTVADAGRGELLGAPDALLLVLRPNLAGVTVARRQLARVPGLRAGLVLRGGSPGDLAEVRSALAPAEPDPVIALPEVRMVQAAADSGSLGVALGRRTLRQVGETCLEWLLGAAGGIDSGHRS